jgi:DnaJ-class molecular chaperone
MVKTVPPRPPRPCTRCGGSGEINKKDGKTGEIFTGVCTVCKGTGSV